MGDGVGSAVIVGEAPSRGGDRYHMFPLSGRPARVLCELAGITPQAEGSTYGRWYWPLREEYDLVNLVPRYANAYPWSAPRARGYARELLKEEPPVVVCLGRRVQAAVAEALEFYAVRVRVGTPGGGCFGEFFTWAAPWHIRVPLAGREQEYAPWLVTIPHPSGLNRILNDERQRRLAGRVLRQAHRRARAA